MPSTHDRDGTDYRDAAAILRGIRSRVADLEEDGSAENRAVRLSRQANETLVVGDTTDVTVHDAGSFVWNESEYGREEWGGPGRSNERGEARIVPSFAAIEVVPTVNEDADLVITGSANATENIEEPPTIEEFATVVRDIRANANEIAPGSIIQNETASLTNRINLFAFETSTADDDPDDPVDVPSGAVNLNDQGLSEGDVIQNYWNEGQNMTVDPGTYTWDGNGPTLDGYSLYGKGNPGDVLLQPVDGTVEGGYENGGGFVNIRIDGANPDSKAGHDLRAGAHFDLYVALGPFHQDEDRHLYTPNGNEATTLVERSAWANASDNGAYVDKSPMHFRHCAAWDNNISQIRVGNRDGTDESNEDIIEDCVIAIQNGVTSHSNNSAHARGVRIRHPTVCRITRTLFDYRDEAGVSGGPIEFHDGANGGEVHLDHVVIYNEGGQHALNNKGSADVILDGPVIVGGPGDLEIQGSISGPGSITTDPGMNPPNWAWDAVSYGEESPVAPFFPGIDGDPSTYP